MEGGFIPPRIKIKCSGTGQYGYVVLTLVLVDFVETCLEQYG